MHSAFCPEFSACCSLHPVFWQLVNGPRSLDFASLIPHAANCIMAPATRSLNCASRLQLDAPASTG